MVKKCKNILHSTLAFTLKWKKQWNINEITACKMQPECISKCERGSKDAKNI